VATNGFSEALRLITGISKRAARPNPALQAVGRQVVNRHIGYYRKSGNQTHSGGGPPGAIWPGLEENTAMQKENRPLPKTKKLINTGLLKAGYDHKVEGNSVLIFNREFEKVYKLQTKGVGRKRKTFTVLATNPEVEDPEIIKITNKTLGDYIFEGKT